MSKTSRIFNEVDSIMTKQIKRHQDVINNSKIEPLDDSYQFCTNGIYFLMAKMGAGKTYFVMKHILITERLFNQPYYDTIIFTSTSGTLDKTVSSMASQIQTPINYVSDTELMPYLIKHLKNKMKFYAVMEFINSDGEEINEIMAHILEKYHLYKPMGGKIVYDLKRIIHYCQAKMEKYGFHNYPSNTLLILDDFAGHDLIKKVDSPLAKIMTKVRHYHLTVIISAQTWRFINLNLKRLCSDIVIGVGFSIEDFQHMIQQTPTGKNWKQLWEQYKDLPDKHSKMIIHCVSGDVEFDE